MNIIPTNNTTSLKLSWEHLNEYEEGNGPITSYTIYTNYTNRQCTDDVGTPTEQKNISLTNYIVIDNLQPYTEYSIQISALTEAGEGPLSDLSTYMTNESIPGSITKSAIIVEPGKREAHFNWSAPCLQNGIITMYDVHVNNIKDNHLISNTSTSPAAVIKPLKPYSNYTVKVRAYTSIGPGNFSEVIQFSTEADAPGRVTNLKLTPEVNVTKPRSLQVTWNEPLDKNGILIAYHILCTNLNDSRGVYKNRTDSNASSFFYPIVLTGVYRVKVYGETAEGNGSIVEKITVVQAGAPIKVINETNGVLLMQPSNEQPPDKEKQIAIQLPLKTFLCNTSSGELKRWGIVVAQDGQANDPDLTTPIAAGISSAVVVIASGALVIFFLRRKQILCFRKDDESLITNTPGVGIQLDKIEPTKKNQLSQKRHDPIKLSELSDVVERFHRDSDLLFAAAYKMLKETSPKHPMTAAEQQCCRPKNRYTNILPFDHSRVKLRPSDDIDGTDYINANYIPGYKSRREYIATQGPMPTTFNDFWRMVWEQNVDTIVMLTKLMENGRRKCDKYWPDLGEPVFYGDLVVSLQSESNMSDYIIKIFEVKTNAQRKMVRHFSYLKWPDMGCPETPELLLEFVKAVKQYGNREHESSNGPMIVHCSAGVGRTGTFIAVDYLLQHIKDHDEVDIFNLVLEMRNNRLNMVQTEDQYIYIHECIKSFITTQQEEEEEDDDEAIYVNTGFGANEENLYANT
ncbi:tyrosine-protein phosphatase 10D-like [Ruditapes philippinarum]|uniref:tyrosine-protein phosphatase 10D-like n=1 Tax=Ruditapes philippinarum TaxID=129788 RepID=UPI00295B31EF|nr:tyrosine-protein phosphatase 10D-like [Ruditapes philippinarum]